ncbi:uncharacterized protein LOC144150222 [Haemaphysalis longicornis]
MEDHSRLLLAPWLWPEAATYLRIHVLGAQPSTSTGAGPTTQTQAERMRQYRAKKRMEEGPLEQARRAARMRDYRAQRKESGQYDPAKEAERKRQYRARKKLEAQQPGEVVTAEEKLRKDAERKRLYRARKKLEAQLAAASSELPLAERTDRAEESERELAAAGEPGEVVTAEEKLRKDAERKRLYRARKKLEAQLAAASSERTDRAEESERELAAAGESSCGLPEGADLAAVTAPKRKYRPKKKAESQLGGVDGSSAGSSEKALAAQRKRQYKPGNKLLGKHGPPALSSLSTALLQPVLKEGHAHAETQCTRWLSASSTQAAILSKTRTVGVQT